MFRKLEGEILEVILLCAHFQWCKFVAQLMRDGSQASLSLDGEIERYWRYCGKQTAWYSRVHIWRKGLDICLLAQAEGWRIICQDAIKCNFQWYDQRGTLTNFILLWTSLLKRLEEPISSTTLLRFRPWEVVFVGFINTFLWKLICLCFYLARLNLFTFGYKTIQILENTLVSFRMSWSGGSICCCNMVWNSAGCTFRWGCLGGYQQELDVHTSFVATK